ncbi:hypothetical protein TRFO_27808 [Tritrichomonas foetus]|uniref:Protein kinase domain-containing protein n=1 Tax=Tritrichomonas foetus TaxID=1144522 RepID=A0A1J4K0A1_9EUKA|nr:hypothetical protein TRFO_27808 [Tritrichomonas foetus]|eukprot:OHT04659.1 hypothetical protein TRFO_27808 [Tritrichomonas foetus]
MCGYSLKDGSSDLCLECPIETPFRANFFFQFNPICIFTKTKLYHLKSHPQLDMICKTGWPLLILQFIRISEKHFFLLVVAENLVLLHEYNPNQGACIHSEHILYLIFSCMPFERWHKIDFLNLDDLQETKLFFESYPELNYKSSSHAYYKGDFKFLLDTPSQVKKNIKIARRFLFTQMDNIECINNGKLSEDLIHYYCVTNKGQLSLKLFRSIVAEAVSLFFINRHKFPETPSFGPSFFYPSCSIESINNKPNPIKFKKTDFIEIDEIGKGSNGVITLVCHKVTGYFYALKKFRVAKRFHRELEVLSCLDSNSILKCYGYIENPMTLVLQYCSNGTLHDLIYNFDYKLLDADKDKFTIQIMIAIDELHKSGFIHRDLKSQNILIDHNFNAFLSDFESCKRGTDLQINQTIDTGTLVYRSPEQMMNSGISYKTDLYSFGILIYELAERKMPYKDKSLAETITMISKGISPNLSYKHGPIVDLYLEMVNPDSNSRIITMLLKKEMMDCHNVLFHSNLAELPPMEEIMMRTKAHDRIGDFYMLGTIRQDKVQLKDAADNGDAESLYFLGEMHWNSIHVNDEKTQKENKEKGMKYYKAAMEKGHLLAKLQYGQILIKKGEKENSYNGKKTVEQGLKLIKEVKDIGYQEAEVIYYRLKLLFNHNFNGSKYVWNFNLRKAFKKIKQLCKIYRSSYSILVKCYLFGVGTKKNVMKALNLAFDIIDYAADGYSIELIAEYYEKGIVLQQIALESIYYYSISGRSLDSDAYYRLYNIYKEGELVPKNEKLELRYLTLAADNMNEYARFELGLQYFYGLIHDENDSKWSNYLSGLNGTEIGTIIQLLLLGDRIPKYQPMFKEFMINCWPYISLAATYGNRSAMYSCGMFYLDGFMVEQNNSLGMFWLIRSAKKGYYLAEHYVAEKYEEGIIVHRNYNIALKYYKSGAKENNYLKSMIGAARIYFNIKKDYRKAYKYAIMAINNNPEFAHEAYQIIEKINLYTNPM